MKTGQGVLGQLLVQRIWKKDQKDGQKTFLVVQWLRIHMSDFPGGSVDENLHANAGDYGFDLLVWEDPTCRGSTKPVGHNY